MSKYTSYNIETIRDILDIPKDSIDDFLIDLKSWYETINNLKQIPNIMSIPEGQIILGGVMTWVDDKKHDCKITIQCKPTDGIKEC
jgi:hypothetical protein